jgi:oxygen-independent coproporphyrinogen III oxidase
MKTILPIPSQSVSSELSANLLDVLRGSPYQAYTYAYPHKTAYRRLEPAVPLATAWAGENRSNLFLYVHIPFCEMRCGFCNLFTTANPHQSLENGFLRALERQMSVVKAELDAAGGNVRFSRMALGGGTPTYLNEEELYKLFYSLETTFGKHLKRIPISVETSPATASSERLQALRKNGVTRVSLGVQSFLEEEVHAVGRAQNTDEVHRTLERLRGAGFPTLNIDLIYGMPNQTNETWLESLRTALYYEPEELFLYPLYVRPLTGLDKLGRSWDDHRVALYRSGRDFLLSNGYEQQSMRVFRRQPSPRDAMHTPDDGVQFDAQHDGLIGLGCGSRSYTSNLHYSSEYAVGQTGVRDIIADFNTRDDASFALASHGFRLDDDEQRRRFVLQGIFNVSGVVRSAYQRRFGSDAMNDFALLTELEAHGLLVVEAETLRLSESGLERSDAIGPALYSAAVNARSEEYQWR